jgi:signal transduction histidine kinase
MWPSTLRWRLTLWYGIGLAIPLIAFAAGCYVLFSRALLHRTDRFVDDALTAFTRELSAERRVAGGITPAMRTTVSEVRFADLRIAILDGTGRVVAGDTIAANDRDHYRISRRPLELEAQRFTLVGAYPLADVEAVLERLRDTFTLLVPLLIACAVVGGYFLAARPLHVTFAEQRRFMADASHELRTPTAILRAEADVTLAQPHRTEEEYRTSLGVMRDAAGRLTRIVEDLFLLARADSGNLVPRAEELYLEDLLVDVTRSVRPLADQRGVHVQLGQVSEAPVRGDVDLLGRALLNLLDNAIKHAPAGSAVGVSLARHDGVAGGRYEIDVSDAGPGIPQDAHERVFERFFRIDAARARAEASATSGAGLGLPIGRRIAELHGGRLDLIESRPGRTVFRVTLPAA